MQKRRRCHCNVTAHARADEDQVARQLLAEVHELRHPRTRLVDAAVINGMGLIALAAGYIRQRGNLPPPRTTLLAMGEDDMAIDYGLFHRVQELCRQCLRD